MVREKEMRERQTEADRDREKQRQTETDRNRYRDRQTETDRDRHKNRNRKSVARKAEFPFDWFHRQPRALKHQGLKTSPGLATTQFA